MIDFLVHYPTVILSLTGISGAIGASLFILIWRSIHGGLITDLAVELELTRQSIHLVTAITLKKGATNALSAKYLRVELYRLEQKALDDRISQWRKCPEDHRGERRVGDIWIPHPHGRSLNSAGSLHSERYVLAIWTPEFERAENFAPLEVTQYASYSEINSDDVYEVIVTVMGERYTSRIARVFYNIICVCFWEKPYRPEKTYYTASAVSIPPGSTPSKV